MKKLIADSSKCTGCGTCEKVCSQTYFKENNREKSAIRIVREDDKYRIDVCDQCGECVRMCSPVALDMGSNGVVRLAKKKCVGCLICVAECLRGFMYYHDDEDTPFKCIACGICVKQCPSGALALTE